MKNKLPVVLVIGGHDPTGGAGIQSDIETVTSLNCHAVSLITCLTSQNTKEFLISDPVNPDTFFSQGKALISDVNIDVIKIGAVGSSKIVEKINDLLTLMKNSPVIVDPIIRSSSGGILTNKKSLDALKSLIFPKSFLVTPNLEEAKSISGEENLDLVIENLLNLCTQYLLIKDVEKSKNLIVNNLYSKSKFIKHWENPRIEGKFHGTGCSLASSIACFMAKSRNIIESIDLAQKYTLKAIINSVKIGKGQKILKGKLYD